MAENEKPLSDFISSVEQVDAPVEEVQESGKGEIKPKKSKVFPIIVGILLLLIIGMGGYYVYKEYFAKEKVDNSEVVIEEEESEDEKAIEVDDTENEDQNNVQVESYTIKNKGWGLLSLPQYEFSIEIPNYTMTLSEPYHEGEELLYRDVKWSWTGKIDENNNSFYPNYLTTAKITFFPEVTEGMFDCGGGCAKEHYITVNIFKNEGSKSLGEVKDIYFANVIKNDEENNYVPAITQKEETRWGHKVISFTQTTPSDMGEISGQIVVNSQFVYHINYFQTKSPVESFEISQRAIESIEMGK